MKSSILRWKITHHNVPWKQLTLWKKGSIFGWCPRMLSSDPWLLWPLSTPSAHLGRVGERVQCQGRISLSETPVQAWKPSEECASKSKPQDRGKTWSPSEFNLKVFLPFLFPSFLLLSLSLPHSHILFLRYFSLFFFPSLSTPFPPTPDVSLSLPLFLLFSLSFFLAKANIILPCVCVQSCPTVL